MSARAAGPASLWRPRDAARWAREVAPSTLGLRVYSSRLLGADSTLVLAGGGNTSAKGVVEDVHGEPVEVLWVKGSGSDLASATARDFTALELAPALRLLDLPELSDGAMMRELLRARLDPAAPPPSVEALLHAFLPHRFVDHAHPDALLARIQTPDGARRAEELYGEDCLIVPYVKPGFDLAVRCRDLWRAAGARARRFRGMVLLDHGLFAFADDARESYKTLLDLVARAARALPAPRPPKPSRTSRRPQPARRAARPRRDAWRPAELARLRAAVSAAAGAPMAARLRDDAEALEFLDRPDLGRITQRGTLTPDHVIRTRRVPLLVADPRRIESAVARWAAASRREFERFRRGRPLVPLDAAPRVALVPGTGVLGLGRTPRAAAIAAEIYVHTAWAIARAEAAGGFRPLAARELFEVEYWELEQAKLARAGAPPPLAGRAALVTGAASGIGRAAARALVARGAAVVGLDLAPSALEGDYRGLEGDAADPATLASAVALAAREFGGLDVLVSNVGVFGPGREVAALDDALWRRTMAVNVDAHLAAFREAIPLLRLAPGGGAIVVVGSKNVAAPGPGAAAYSASKAALTQLARVAALELAPAGVRVNVVHPDAVFDTGLWTPAVLAARAARYGLSVEQYRKRNLLGREIASADVGALIAELAGDLFAKTTGAQIPIDGGSDRVI